MISYVAGFLFAADHVLLVKKIKPDWQSGLWNGVGGKLEISETPIVGMIREFREETGLDVLDWRQFCTEAGRGYVVHFFAATHQHHSSELAHHNTLNDVGEQLGWCNLTVLSARHNRHTMVGNLQWLIPLALDPRGFTRHVVVEPAADIKDRPTW